MSNDNCDNCLWVACCFGCRAPVALVKGVLCMVPVAILSSVPILIIAVMHWIPDIFIAYYTVARAPQLGTNISALILATLWIPLLVWPLAATIGALVCGLFLGFGAPITATFDSDVSFVGSICNGIVSTAAFTYKWLREFWQWKHHDFYAELDAYTRNARNAPRWDISCWQLVQAMAMLCLSCVIDGLLIAFAACVYVIPVIMRGYWWMWSEYWVWMFKCSNECEEWFYKIWSFPFWLVANVLLPVGVLALWCVACLGGVCCGAVCASETYTTSWRHAMALMWRMTIEAEAKMKELATFEHDDDSHGFLYRCLRPLAEEPPITMPGAAQHPPAEPAPELPSAIATQLNIV